MILNCKIDQASAIRRGFDTNSTVKLDVDPADFDEKERAMLAKNFSGGDLETKWGLSTLPEPTIAGLYEVLRNAVAKEETDALLTKEKAEHEFAAAMEIIRNKKIKTEKREVHASRDLSKNIVSSREGAHAVTKTYDYSEVPYSVLSNSRASKTPECKELERELFIANNHALAEAYNAAYTECKAIAEKADARKADSEKIEGEIREYLRQVILKQGTTLQKIRLERGLINLNVEAVEILTQQNIENIGGLQPYEPDEDTDDVIEAEYVSDAVMDLILEYEKANPGATVTPHHVIRTVECDYVEAGAERFGMISVDLPNLHEINLHRSFRI